MDFYNQGLVVQGSRNDMKRYFRIDEASTFFIKVSNGRSIDEVKERIDDLYGKRYRLILISNTSIREQALTLMDQAFSMFDVGVHPKVVQERLGHSSINLTLTTYSSVLPDIQDEAVDRLEKYLSRPEV